MQKARLRQLRLQVVPRKAAELLAQLAPVAAGELDAAGRVGSATSSASAAAGSNAPGGAAGATSSAGEQRGQQPHEAYMKQMARNLTDAVDGFLLKHRHVIMDRDPLFCRSVRDMFKNAV